MSSFDAGPINVEALLRNKAVPPLEKAAYHTLERIESRNVEGYSEADVREEVITPLLGVLGYDKGSYFSIEREKEIKLAGSNRFLDYSMTLWSENFWLVEAKRPDAQREKFSDRHVEQAVLYAAHPEINAALVVLCDGHKIAVFDREENLSAPLLTARVDGLIGEIQGLRALLSPWQIWLFEKRRLVRYLDKAVRREFNVGRVEELRTMLSQRLDAQRARSIGNVRKVVAATGDKDEAAELFEASNATELIEAAFFVAQTKPAAKAITDTMIRHYADDPFGVLYRMLPERPRDMNDEYCGRALAFLVGLRQTTASVPWIPSWLGGGQDLEGAIKALIPLCLTYFESDVVRRGVLLMAAGLRRVFKAMMAVDERVWRAGEVVHGLTRYLEPEDEWAQLLSTPVRQNILILDQLVCLSMATAIRRLSTDRGGLKPQMLRQALADLWRTEVAIVEAVPSYRDLLGERGLAGEVFPTESVGVRFDYLGHLATCVLEEHAVWKTYVQEHHSEQLKVLSQLGSWQARKWLGKQEDGRPSESLLADRFFYGDGEILSRLSQAYGV